MAADYTIPGNSPSIPPPPPPEAEPSKAGLPAPAEAGNEQAMPKVNEVTVLARQVVFVDGPRKGTIEYQVSLTATPDTAYPASHSIDRLHEAARTKLQQYLQEAL